MKKINKFVLPFLLLPLVSFAGCKSNDNKIVVAEVTHSLFYAPLYLAQNMNLFEKEGLDVKIITTPGADKVMSSLLSKEAQIGLMGPEASVYVYQNGQKDYVVNFSQLTQKDGSFLIGRNKEEDFSYSSLKGKTIIGGRKGGMPEMVLEHVLKEKGLTLTRNNFDPTCDVNIRTDVSFDVMTGVFTSDEDSADYVTAFEPTASQIERLGQGYVVASLGKDSGNIPYTCFSSLKSYLNKNEDKLIKFTRAIASSLKLVNEMDDEELAKILLPSFDSTKEEIKESISRYKSIEAYPSKLGFEENSFNKLISIIKEAGELDMDVSVPYSTLVTSKIIEAI